MTTGQPPLDQTVTTARAPYDDPELGEFLPPGCFPATRDGLLAILARGDAPTRLLWELARLSPQRVYDDVQQVHAAVESAIEPAQPYEPI
ncbi:MAG: hypothetical protein WB473_07080 [Pedococcus sp.]